MVFNHSGVSIGSLVSKMMRAALRITVPGANPGFGMTVNNTRPLPSGEVTFGGRKPASGSVGGKPVSGSSDVKRYVSRPVLMLSCAVTRTITLFDGRRSTSAWKLFDPGSGYTSVVPNAMGPR